jgi:hypothetical protein
MRREGGPKAKQKEKSSKQLGIGRKPVRLLSIASDTLPDLA